MNLPINLEAVAEPAPTPSDSLALHDAVIPPTLVNGIFDLADRYNLRSDRWLSGTTLTREILTLPDTRLSFAQASSILHRALHELPAGPNGIHIGSRDVLVHWGVLGFAMRSCDSIGEAFAMGLELHQACGSLMDYSVDFDEGEFSLRIAGRITDQKLLPFLYEEACASTVTMARCLLGSGWTPFRIEFPYPRPPFADFYSKFFRCPIRFDSVSTRIYFPSDILSEKIPTSCPAQVPAALRIARELAAADDHSVDIVTAVEGVLRQNLKQPATMAFVAKQLRISERTLHRRLSDSGKKFGQIRDLVRMERATTLLRESDLPIGLIGEAVGFSDGREFRRAYRRWTGQSPSIQRGTSERPPVRIPSTFETFLHPAVRDTEVF